MIEVKNISKKFNNNVVLNGIDLNINKGDVVAIIGPSGTGKSTFLRCLNRLEKPESGSISIGDLSVDLARSDKKSLVELRKKTSMVFQGFNLFSHRTALENVMEALIVVKKMNKDDAKKIAKEEFARVGLQDRMNYYPHPLSGGQQFIAHGDHIADFHLARRLGISAVYRHLVRAHGICGIAAGLEHPHRPKILVQTNIVHIT